MNRKRLVETPETADAALADLIATLEADVEAHGTSYTDRGRTYSNPSVGTLLEARKALSTGLQSFGATPQSRVAEVLSGYDADPEPDAGG